MVHVRKTVDAREGVVRHTADYAVHYAGGAGRRGNLSRVEYVETERVIGLVSGPVRDGDSFRESQGLGRLAGERALHPKSGLSKRQHGLVKPKILQKGSAGLILFKVPENSFRQAAHGGAHRVREPHGNIVSGQHHFPDAAVHLGLVLLYPGQLGGRKVAGRVQKVPQAVLLSQGLEGFLSVRNSTGVAPDDGRPENVHVPVYAHQPVHLIGDADGLDILGGYFPGRCQYAGRSHAQVAQPHGRVLLGPARPFRDNGSLCFREKIRGDTLSGLGLYEGRFYGRTSDVITQQIHR